MKIVNLTPHALHLYEPDAVVWDPKKKWYSPAGDPLLEVPSSGVVRLDEVSEAHAKVAVPLRVLGNIPVRKVYYHQVEGLSEPQAGVLYVVSLPVRIVLPGRPDVVSPGEAVRDDKGRQIGCIGFTSSAVYKANALECARSGVVSVRRTPRCARR